jgi:hypothetical protein
VFTIVHTGSGTYADLVIQSNGEIRLIAAQSPASTNTAFVSLEGISYAPCGSSSALTSTADWSFYAGWGADTPGFTRDADSFVHLQGAVRQVSSSGDPTLIAQLPAGALPFFTVYTIVHTGSGTYADLVINPKGEIRVIPPAPPAVANGDFLSLESITYLAR